MEAVNKGSHCQAWLHASSTKGKVLQQGLRRLCEGLHCAIQITAHLKEKIRSIAQEEVILKHKLQALDAASKEKQDGLRAAKAASQRSLLESKRVMKDFSRITDPALIEVYQASSPVSSSIESLYGAQRFANAHQPQGPLDRRLH